MESGENKRGYSIILEPDKNLCSVFPTSVLSKLIFLEEKIHGSFVRSFVPSFLPSFAIKSKEPAIRDDIITLPGTGERFSPISRILYIYI